jgi:hypothetical protein
MNRKITKKHKNVGDTGQLKTQICRVMMGVEGAADIDVEHKRRPNALGMFEVATSRSLL